MFILVAFVIFAVALSGAGYMVWHVPQQETEELLAARLRELRANSGVRTRSTPDLFKREKRGSLAALGDFVSWIGILRRLQMHIDQANLKYRAAEVFTLAVLIAVGSYAYSVSSCRCSSCVCCLRPDSVGCRWRISISNGTSG